MLNFILPFYADPTSTSSNVIFNWLVFVKEGHFQKINWTYLKKFVDNK